jgi:hypothetical protein
MADRDHRSRLYADQTLRAGSAAGNPQVYQQQADERGDENPPRLAARRAVFLGDVFAAAWTALGVFVNVDAAIGAGNGGLFILVVGVEIAIQIVGRRVIVPFVIGFVAVRHGRVSELWATVVLANAAVGVQILADVAFQARDHLVENFLCPADLRFKVGDARLQSGGAFSVL